MRLSLRRILGSLVGMLVGVGLCTSSPASAETFQFIYQGVFNSADALNPDGGPTSYFAAPTPFTAFALFDDTSPNLVAPVGVPGFVSYSPLWATLTVGGQTYQMVTHDQDPGNGVGVAIFDDTTPFVPGHYGAGFIQDPLADGAGFVGDWLGASPPFSAGHLVSTEFIDYEGVGYGAGPNFGAIVVPIPLRDSNGGKHLLTLGNYIEVLAQGGPLNSARLQAVPEPGSMALLLGLGVTGLSLAARRRKK